MIANPPRSSATAPRSLAVLAALAVLCVGGGAVIGALFAGEAAYTQHDLPRWAPPSWLFGPCGRSCTR